MKRRIRMIESTAWAASKSGTPCSIPRTPATSVGRLQIISSRRKATIADTLDENETHGKNGRWGLFGVLIGLPPLIEFRDFADNRCRSMDLSIRPKDVTKKRCVTEVVASSRSECCFKHSGRDKAGSL